MSGLKSRRKGARFELEIVAALQELGIAAIKMPLSGALENFQGDILCPVRGQDKKLEAKRRRRAYSTIYSQLGSNYALVLRDDHVPALVVLRLSDFADLAK